MYLLQSIIKKLLIFIFIPCFLLSSFVSCSLFSSESEGEGEVEYDASEDDEDEDEDEDEDDNGNSKGQEWAEEDIEYIDEEDEDMLSDVNEEDEYAEVKDSEILSNEGMSDEGDASSYETVDMDSIDQGSLEANPQPSSTPESVPETVTPVQTWVPVKKIKTTPYNTAGFLVNAVYIVRPDDTIQSISLKIFNSDQSEQLWAINPHLKNKGLKVGDKVYYQSPTRPEDSSSLLFYFEDIGARPEIYSASPGENIRTLSSQLLDDPNSWKEIWASNPEVESKWVLNQAVNLKYWISEEPMPMPEPAPAMPEEPEEPMPAAEPAPESMPEEPSPSSQTPEEVQKPEKMPSPFTSDGANSQISTKESNFMGKISRDVIIGLVLVVFVIILVFLIRNKRKKKAFDYTAANFEMDPEDD